ncbi:MAG: peptide chain release factor N(5)-glutamine methyltransferase [bacterium]
MSETWTIQRLLNWTTEHFKSNNLESARLETEILLAHALDLQRIQLYANFNREVQPHHLAIFRSYVERRLKNEPLAYIVGFQPFLGLDFEVNNHVLIPRPETEQLVELAIERVKGSSLFTESPNPLILDIGTGSGCIAVSLAKYLPNAHVIGIDISEQALEIAKRNAVKHGVQDRCQFVVKNMLEKNVAETFRFPHDLIISNPPYIRSADIETLEPNVKDWEPKQALDGGADGLDYIRALFHLIPKGLNPKGLIMFEFGIGQAKEILNLSQGIFKETKIVKDLAGIERIFVGKI